MLESTNALLATVTAVLRELKRCRLSLESGSLSEAEEEELGPFIDQLHEALSDISVEYDARRTDHPNLISLDRLKARIASETPTSGA